jgi:hypothetical protein
MTIPCIGILIKLFWQGYNFKGCVKAVALILSLFKSREIICMTISNSPLKLAFEAYD